MHQESSPVSCSAEELYSFVCSANKSHLLLSLLNPHITEEHILSLLRNPHITLEIIQAIHDRFSKSNKIQFGIVNCPKTPYTLSLRLLPSLFWNDLIKICSNYRLFPPLRRSAENYIRERIPSLTPGERKTLARTAPRSLISLLRSEADPAVFSCLLRNPRLVEEDLLPLLSDSMTPVAILETIGSDRQWIHRYPIRVGLARNSRTPLRITLSLLSRLQKQDLEQIAKLPGTPDLIKMSAERILNGKY